MAASREQIEATQLNRLRTLLSDLKSGGNRFYVPKLEAAGVDTSIGGLAEFSAMMPVTTKEELVADHLAKPPYGTNLTEPVDNYTRFHQTSGTSGEPMAWLDTNESWSALIDCWCEVFREAGVGRGDRVFFAFSFGPFLGFWTAFEAATRLGALAISGGGMSTGARIALMKKHKPQVLCCTPTYALRLGEEAGVDFVKKILVAGEAGGSIPETRERMSKLWGGAAIFDHHGMTETGPVTFEKNGALCVIEDAYYAEICDPETGAVCDEGELILTTLRRNACPLLRYRTGDLVRRKMIDGWLCLEGGILGRIDDMVVVRGVNIYPSAIESVLRGFAGLVEYRVHLKTERAMTEISVEVEGDIPLAEIESSLRDRFALRIPVRMVEAGTLPKFEFKSQRWIKEIS
jgi:phenylacetate-CoA ligase